MEKVRIKESAVSDFKKKIDKINFEKESYINAYNTLRELQGKILEIEKDYGDRVLLRIDENRKILVEIELIEVIKN